MLNISDAHSARVGYADLINRASWAQPDAYILGAMSKNKFRLARSHPGYETGSPI
jgi:hypothetical protein